MEGPATQDLLHADTRSAGDQPAFAPPRQMLVLTIACHPDSDRVGQRCWLTGLTGSREVRISRSEPAFAPPDAGAGRPLLDPWLSREPITLGVSGPNVVLQAGVSKTPLRIDGRPVGSARVLEPEELALGVVLELGDRIALVLRRTEVPEGPARPVGELLGSSAGMTRLREEIARVAPLDYPILLRGESGTGKELAARALHAASRRAGQAFVAINAGAIPRELAAGEIFGAARGAYTGADRDRGGLYRRAHGGTFFIDEIGESSAELQVLLLRVLETGEIQPLGGDRPVQVDARVISATDADLEAAVAAGRFRSPLLHRLASFEILLPPLRERREDFGSLFFHFLRAELAALGEEHRLATRGIDSQPYVPAALVARLSLARWPGNVRQLRNVVRQLVVASRGADRLQSPAGVDKMLELEASPPSPLAAPAAYRSPSGIGDEELLAALRAEGFNVHRAARRLQVSRTTLYKLMEDCPRVRRAADLGGEEITAAWRERDKDLESAAAALEVSPRGLQLRIRELGLRL